MTAESVVVSKDLLKRWVEHDSFVASLVKAIEEDEEVRELLYMSNVNAVLRLGYNDHGPVHAKIVAGTALELMRLLALRGASFSSLQHDTAANLDDVKLILVASSYLHDIGNAVHRDFHELIGAILAKDIVDRVIDRVRPGIGARKIMLRQEVLSAIYSTAMEAKPLTVEASIVRLADGLDMSEGRARLPYKLGKHDMHSLSALSIRKVELRPGAETPIEVLVYMSDMAGFFQVERVLMPKIEGGKLKGLVKVFVFSERDGRSITLA
ncbi:MAG: phosphohydrolase [Thermofilum sp.]|uniref:Phosphohydrolase n=1 Tax=Thermofilum pendens TaxID=2269 RepID=A0A7C4H6H5_THEPE